MNVLRLGCIGEAMIELSQDPAQPGLARIGTAGDTLNTAIYLKRSAGSAISVSYVTALGDDPHSASMLDFMAGEGLEISATRRLAGALPGLYWITTGEAGERSFHYWRQNSAARQMFGGEGNCDFSALGELDVVYLSAISLAILPDPVRQGLIATLSDARKQRQLRVAFDSNYRPRLWESANAARKTIAAMWQITDIALPSLDDEMAVFEETSEHETAARLRETCPGTGVIKRGLLGPLPLDTSVAIPDLPRIANPLDTTAAGDSFNGAFLASFLLDGDLEKAMQAGHACASKVICHRGAIIPATAQAGS